MLTRQNKICVIIYGNIASGKSAIANELIKTLIHFQYLSIDSFRLQNADEYPYMNAMEREKKSEQDLELALNNSSHIIYETTGASLIYKRIKSLLISKGFKLHFVHIDCPVSTCVKRYDDRLKNGYRFILPPYNNKSIPEIMEYIKQANNHIDADIEINSKATAISHAVNKILTSMLL